MRRQVFYPGGNFPPVEIKDTNPMDGPSDIARPELSEKRGRARRSCRAAFFRAGKPFHAENAGSHEPRTAPFSDNSGLVDI